MSEASSPTPSSTPRLMSLDALRGFDMLWIIGADAIGSALNKLQGCPPAHFLGEQLDHVAWQGFRFYDLIFAMFVFMMGAAIPLSLDKITGSEGRGAAIRRVLRRVVLLYLVGLFYYGGLSTSLDNLRLLGVLQRIALCYGAASLLYLFFNLRGLFISMVLILGGYWAMLRFIPVPGFGAGDFAEGHNLTNWFDSQYLPFRKWDGDHDPEGILSTIPAVASCLLGVLASLWLTRSQKEPRWRGLFLLLAGLGLVCLGFAWGTQFPVIKKLWTSSFVLVAGGWSCALLGCFYLLIDVHGWKAWAQPFVWVGCNSLTIYLISNVVDFNALAARFAGGPVQIGFDAMWPGLGSLVLALTGAGLCFLICRFLYLRKVFLRL